MTIRFSARGRYYVITCHSSCLRVTLYSFSSKVGWQTIFAVVLNEYNSNHCRSGYRRLQSYFPVNSIIMQVGQSSDIITG